MRSAIFVVLALASAAVLAADEQPAVRPRVTVSSQPSGATVSVDGMDRGVTPLVIYDLGPGRHHLRYRLAGYEDRDRFFTMDEGPVLEKSESLVPEKGLLLLRSDPPGCAISIDGVAAGTTPRLFTDLDAKETYKVSLTKAGYLPQDLVVKFNRREPLVRDEKMVLDSGAISIISDPAGAEVTVNGIVRGVTPLEVKDVPKGRAAVKFRLDGFAEEVRELAMRAGDRQTLSIVLSPLPGSLHLASVPNGARFYLDEEARGQGPLAITGLKPGAYRVRAELAGYGTIEKTVEIKPGEATREEFRLSNVMGRLEVRTDPPGATVIFDGKVLGTTKGPEGAAKSNVFAIENILEGEHVLIVRKDGYEESSRKPKIRSSKTSQANVRLKRVFVPDIELETVHGTVRGVLVEKQDDCVKVEVSLGITRTIPRNEIRKYTPIGEGAK